jgi:Asp-tRNA(Asn)/Glu-tRNA(Gln) amidotransferase C subunit
MTALDEQKIANLKAIIATKKQHEELDRAQVDHTIAKDEAWSRREKEKNNERRQHALNLMKESEDKHQKLQAAAQNGATRGQKMTSEEIKFNKGLLKEVSKIKKEGQFENLFERCTSKKVTTFD